MEHHKVTCDGCGGDISSTGGLPAFRLQLGQQPLPHTGGVVYSVAVQPPLDHTHHFCGMNCLSAWMDSWKAKREAERQAREKRRASMQAGGVTFVGTSISAGSPTIVLRSDPPPEPDPHA